MTDNTTTPTLPPSSTNAGFAARTGVHFTMASRLRSGARSPSISTFLAVVRGYDMPCDRWMSWLEAIDQGNEASGAWLRENIFADPTALSSAG